nr:hypothetical protein [Tanacetum cinerariifolium]
MNRFRECSSYEDLYTTSFGYSKGDFADKFVRNPNKTTGSSQRPPQDCPKCGNPVDDFLNTSESSNEDSNVVNAPQEPIVFNQNPGEDSSQSPPQIDHQCCYGCGDPLNGVFCRRCTCESCGNGAHIGYNCPPKVLVVSNPEPCHNQNVDELPQTLTNFHPTCYFGDENSFAHDSTPNFVNDSPNVFHPPPQTLTNSYEFCGNDAHYSHDCHPQVSSTSQETSVEILHDHENVINFVQTFLRKFNRFCFFKTPKVLLLAWDRVSKIKNAFGNKQYKPEDVQELFHKLFNDVQNIHEELAEYINIPSWNRHAFSSPDDDDDEDYTIAITPEGPDNSLSMGDEHLDTILETESDEVIKYSIENLVLILKPRVHVPNVLTTHPTLMLDSDFIPSDNSLPEFEIFYFDIEEKNSGSTTIYADISLPDLECFNFNSKPDPGELTSIVDSGICKNVLSATNVNLLPEEDHSPLFAYVVWIFLSFLTYTMVPLNLLSYGNEDTIFDPGISNYHFLSLLPDVSHLSETFMKFNV